MKTFNLFGSKPKEERLLQSNSIPSEYTTTTIVDNEESKEETSNNKHEFITIKWYTGMPIDVIFNYIHKDFEDEGYQDALINSDIQYRETKESIIRNNLKMLFMRISLKYKNDIREISVQIDNAQKSYSLSSASLLQARKETYEDHLEKIAELETLLDANDPKMQTMIESYRRGFTKGIAAITLNFINN